MKMLHLNNPLINLKPNYPCSLSSYSYSAKTSLPQGSLFGYHILTGGQGLQDNGHCGAPPTSGRLLPLLWGPLTGLLGFCPHCLHLHISTEGPPLGSWGHLATTRENQVWVCVSQRGPLPRADRCGIMTVWLAGVRLGQI